MKLVNARDQWMIEGVVLGLIYKHKALSADEMQTFYMGVEPGIPVYERLRAPIQYDRTVLLASYFHLYIIPMTPDIQVIETEDKA